MTTLQFKKTLFISLLLIGGLVNADERQKQIITLGQFSPDTGQTSAQTPIEQAADQFDAFAQQMPGVIKAKFNAFMTHGFRAVLTEDGETKPAEEHMIGSLVQGLQMLGNSLADDFAQRTSIQDEHRTSKNIREHQ